jgi:hypothetical protein
MLVYADPDKGNGAPLTADSRFDGTFRRCFKIRRLRLFSGLVMLAYVTMHPLNHAVGLISLEAMENVLWYIFRIWTNRPAQLLLYCSFLVHYASSFERAGFEPSVLRWNAPRK